MRSALLGTAAAGALLLGYGRRAYAQTVLPPASGPCTLTGATEFTCTGDVSAGVALNNAAPDTYDTLNVNSLSQDIGANGISFTSDDNITINSDTGAYSINATGAAIYAYTTGTSNSVTITSSGDVNSSSSYGIRVYNTTTGDVTVNNYGTVSTTSNRGAISVKAYGDVTVRSSGDVYSQSGHAIEVTYGIGDTKIYNYAAVTGQTGIFVDTSASATIISTGDVTGTTDDAIYARGAAGVTITLNSGTVDGNLNGVSVQGSAILNNYATLRGDANAFRMAAGTSTINNSGTIDGNIYSGIGTVTFNNNAGGIFDSGASVNLGTGTLTNAGTLSPGGTGTVQTTALTGSLTQTATGDFVVDIDEGGAGADAVTITGTADFAGTVTPNVINISSTSGSLVIASAAALTSTAVVVDPGGFGFSLQVQGNDLVLLWQQSTILSLLTRANANQKAIAAYLDATNAAGPSAGLQALYDALLALGETDLLAALNQLIPELYSDAQIGALYSSLGFANNLLSCKVNGTSTAAIIGEGQCLWAGANATFLDQSSTFSNLGFTDTTGSFAAGVQFALDPVWRLGFGAGYQQSSLSTAANANSDSDTAQAGVALKYNSGPLLVAGVVSGGRGWYDTTRPVAFTGFSGVAQSSSTIDVLNGGLRIAYVFGSPQLYFKPTLDAAATRLDLGGFSETGGGAANLNVLSNKQTVYTIAPAVEMGTEWWLANGTLIRPFVRAGATFYEGNDFALSASFLGAPAGVSPFTIRTEMDDVMGVVGAGLDMVTAGNTVLHLGYDGQLGDTTKIHSVGIKGSVQF